MKNNCVLFVNPDPACNLKTNGFVDPDGAGTSNTTICCTLTNLEFMEFSMF